jgi:hypothetical protein
MKSNLFICLILIFAFNSTLVAQNSVRKTLNYQAVILDPKPVEIPGKSLVNQPLFKAEVCLKFALLNGQSGATDYEETQQVTTDEYGLVSVSIGNGISTGQGTFKTFDSIKWDAAIKSLKVSVSYDACTNYKAVSTQSLNYSPYALFAESTEYANVRGVPTKVSQFQNDAEFLAPKDLDPLHKALSETNQAVESNKIIAENNFIVSTKKLDTLKNNITAMNSQLAEQSSRIVDVHSLANNAKQAADNAFNMASNANNQISTIQNQLASQNANAEQITNKSISVTGDGTSDIKYPSVKAVKDYVDGQVTSGIAGVTTPDATTTTMGKIQLAGDLSGTASNPTVPALDYKANLSSPAFTGSPTAPTATAGDNSLIIANTSFVATAVASGTTPDATTITRGKIQLTGDLGGTATNPTVPGLVDKASLESPIFRGLPEAPTPNSGDNSSRIATTAFVTTVISSLGIVDATTTSTGKIQLAGDLAGTATAPTVPGLAAKAPLNSPVFTGAPTAPTPTAGDNTNQIATTSFVRTALAFVPDASTTTTGKIQLAGDLAGTATSPTVPGLAAKAPLNSPALTGTPTAPTASAGNNTTQIATTSFVSAALTAAIVPASSTVSGIVNNTANQELGGVDKSINGLIIGKGGANIGTNQAFGVAALSANTTGVLNQAIGYQSLRLNTTGFHNVASGYQSLGSNTIGVKNSAYGVQSLYLNTLGNRNVALGVQSLYNNTIGNNNVALGSNALYYNTSGSDNIGIGYQAGYLSTATTGNNNIYIGNNALPSAAVSNEIVIGNNTVGRGQNTVAIGNSSITNNYFYGAIDATAFNVTSDQRLKTNIAPLTNANQLINRLVPVSYDKKINLADIHYSVMNEYGFIAQEVQKVLPMVISADKGKDGLLSINYTSLIPLLTKALQEQGQDNQMLKQQISQQSDLIEAQAKRLLALEKSLEKLLTK